MFKRIVIALDLGEDPKRLTELIKEFMDERESKIYLIHVVDLDSAGAMAETLKSDDEAALKNIAAGLSQKGLDVKTWVAVGSPVQEILAYADEVGAELIVVGAHNKGFASSIILGSVSKDVIKHSKLPVLVLKDRASK
ncbi:universal stress protein G [archaeon BMS3Abin16]|nr:universal stress protein G [archaeon BMS3Abin16]